MAFYLPLFCAVDDDGKSVISTWLFSRRTLRLSYSKAFTNEAIFEDEMNVFYQLFLLAHFVIGFRQVPGSSGTTFH